jgi:hypothetical protein
MVAWTAAAPAMTERKRPVKKNTTDGSPPMSEPRVYAASGTEAMRTKSQKRSP